MLSRQFFRDTSHLGRTDRQISTNNRQRSKNGQAAQGQQYNGLFGENQNQNEGGTSTRQAVVQREPVKYKARQVIERENTGFERDKVIPMGTNLIGQLLTSIDTREPEQFYKVFLPYGGKFKGGAEIPKGSTLYGKIRYSGKGRKVFISFTKGVFPTGQEFAIQAQALNSKDYSPGILGDFHGQTGSRVAATLGLSVISAASNVLTERQELGRFGAVAPKANLKNAMYAGISRAAEMEASRQAESLNEKEEYVTVDAGKDLIVNLTGEYKE